jgi:hypothetical protein
MKSNAQVVKLVDTPDLGSGAIGVEVRVLSWANQKDAFFKASFLFLPNQLKIHS